jgi:hypothetical protein
VNAPTDDELHGLLQTVIARLMKLLTRRGVPIVIALVGGIERGVPAAGNPPTSHLAAKWRLPDIGCPRRRKNQ